MTGRSETASGRRRRVVIVGGGLAGLSAAEAILREHRQRFEVTVLEAKRNVGGRAGSFHDPDNGQPVDYCQHVAMGCCTNLLALLDRCGLGDSMDRYRQLWFHHPEHPTSRFAGSRLLPPPAHLLPALRGLQYLDRPGRHEIRRAMWKLMRTSPHKLQDQTARDWLANAGQSPETVRGFWDVILVSALGEQTDVVSISAARKVLIDGFAAARGASDVLVPRRPLSTLFASQLRQAVASLRADVRTSSSVTRLHFRDGSIAEVETASGERFPADHLISAVAWHGFGKLAKQIDDYRPPAVDQIGSSPITGLHLWFDRAITERPHAVMVGTLSQWLFRRSGEGGESSSQQEHYYQVVVSASATLKGMPKETIVSRVVDELRHAFPKAVRAKLLRHRMVTDPQSVFSLTPAVERIRPPARTALPWLHLAGDWIATGWPATMEGAVISGRMAAASMLENEQLPPGPIDPGLPRGWLARTLIR